MKRSIIALLLVTLLMAPLACARAPEESVTGEGGIPAPSAPPSPSITIPSFGGKGTESVPVPEPAPVPAPSPYPPPKEIADTGDSLATEPMIVRTGNMSLVVEDVTAAIDRIAELANGFEGYVVTSSSWREGERLVGNISVRVAVRYFDDAMRALRAMAVEVNSETTSSKDVTEEYVDLDAKLRNLEATEEQLLKLMEKAEKVEDILSVQRELSRTRGEIEQTQGRMQYLERTASSSLIDVSLQQSKLDVRFTANRNTIKTSENIRFSAEVSGGFTPYSYAWNFGDGSTSTSQMPSHDYDSRGSYTVTLKVTDDRGNTAEETREDYIMVTPDWVPGNVASSAWSGLATFGRALVNVLIWLGIFSPVWIVFGGIIYWLIRRKKKGAR